VLTNYQLHGSPRRDLSSEDILRDDILALQVGFIRSNGLFTAGGETTFVDGRIELFEGRAARTSNVQSVLQRGLNRPAAEARVNLQQDEYYTEDGSHVIQLESSLLNFGPQYDPATGVLLPWGLRLARGLFGDVGVVDKLGRHVELTIVDGEVVKTEAWDGLRNGGSGVTVETTYSNGRAVDTNIKLNNNPVGIEFSDAGSVLGQQLGYLLADGDELVGIVSSAALQTIGDNLGDVLDGLVGNQSVEHASTDAFATFGPEFLANLKSAGIGALSSFLTTELIDALGVDGFAGELFSTAAGTVVSTMLNNLASGASIAEGLSTLQIETAVGAFLGNKLANEVVSFESVGGQIGAAVGSTLAVLAATAMVGGPPGLILGAAAAFVGNIIGGAIGSIFGGTPRSGADVQWDAAKGQFVVANVYARKGGSGDIADSMASAVAETFNGVLAATGGRLMEPGMVQAGNYGMRKSEFVYRPYSTTEKEAITARFKGDDAADRLISYGIFEGLTDPDFKIAGGDVYVKRALYSSLDQDGLDPLNFDPANLFGNIATAQRYETYLANSAAISALIAAEPDSVFAAEWAITFARATELGLTRRHESDWYGGFTELLDEAQTSAANMSFGFDYDPFADKLSRSNGVGDYILGDSIDIAGQTMIEGTSAGETIDLRSGKLADQRGFTVNGGLMNDIAMPGTGGDFTAMPGSMVSFSTTDLRKQITTVIANDGVAEGMESFLANLASASGMTIMGDAATATIVSDSAAKPTLMVGKSYAAESDGYAVFRVSLSKAATAAVTIGLSLSDSRASGLGVDYGVAGAGAGNLQYSINGTNWTDATSYTFAAGSTAVYVRTPVKVDNATDANGDPTNVEGQETFDLVATVTSGATYIGNGTTPVRGTGTIIDGTSSNPYVWIDDLTVHEGDSAITATAPAVLTISRSRAGTAGTVIYSTADRRQIAIDVAATVDGGAGNDTIHASDLGDNVFGGTGNDTINGGRLDDWLLGGDGADTLNAGSAATNTLGGDGNYLDGGTGDDELYGREGSDWLEGGDGLDKLTGDAGDDILTGGAGAGDDLKGGAGSDQYLLRSGDGADIAEDVVTGSPAVPTGGGDYISQRFAGLAAGTIARDWIGDSAPGITNGTLSGGEDAIVFGQGISIGDVQLKRDPANQNNLIAMVWQTDPATGAMTFAGTQLTMKDWFSDPFKRIEWMKFADGNEVRIADFTSFVIGGSGNDVLIGTLNNDFVWGGDGQDKLFLLAGDDIGNGGTGDDQVEGDSGKDVIVGGLGTDILAGATGTDAISGDAGDDDIHGGADNDIVSGGRGNDLIAGGAGDDVIKFNRGDGADTVVDEYAGSWVTIWQAAGTANGTWQNGYTYDAASGEVRDSSGAAIRKNFGTEAEPDHRWINGRYEYDSLGQTLKRFVAPTSGSSVVDADATSAGDMIEFAPGIAIQDVVHQRKGNDLVLYVGRAEAESDQASALSDSITLKDWFLAPNSIERLAFYNTGVLNLAANGADAGTSLVSGTDGDDSALAGGSGKDWVSGGAGNDFVSANSGDDIVNGDAGNDQLRGEAGDDVIYGGAGDDILSGGSSLGTDLLIGGAGSDTASYAGSLGVTASLFAPGSNTGEAAGDAYSGIENLLGSDQNDTLTGDEGQNILEGSKGQDTLRAGAGDDVYVWNATSATVHDGADDIREGVVARKFAVDSNGNLQSGYSTMWVPQYAQDFQTIDHYLLKVFEGTGSTLSLIYQSEHAVSDKGTNSMPISGFNSSAWLAGYVDDGAGVARESVDISADAGNDTLELGAGIGLGDLTFAWSTTSANDLVISYKGQSSSQVTLKDQKTVGGRVETLQFCDGLSISLTNLILAAGGTGNGDFIVGAAGNETLHGLDGDDVIFGGAGVDNLYGDNGDDVIEGGAGGDNIYGGTNSAATDAGKATSWGDTVRYASSTALVQVNLSDTLAEVGGDAAGDTLDGIENVVGSLAFSDELVGNASANRLFGLGGNDTLRGLAGDDVLVGDDGTDTLWGGDGNDNLTGGLGYDTLQGEAGNDILVSGEGRSWINGGDGDDQVFGGDGDNVSTNILLGGTGNDLVYGGAGADQLQGDGNDDILAARGGTDTILGGAGNDTYLAGAFDGSDTITDTSGINKIVFEDVAPEQLWLTQAGNDLRIGVIGGDTTLTYKNFFATTSTGLLNKIEAGGESLFVNHADIRSTTSGIPGMIASMTAVSATSTPTELPQSILDRLSSWWDAGETAAPRAPANVQRVSVLNHNANLFDMKDWPGVGDTLPTGPISDPSWSANLLDEISWVEGPGPDGDDAVLMRAGQIGTADAYGGGVISNQFVLDPTRAYEFTYYFKKTELTHHSVYFGVSNAATAYVETLDGVDQTNPYFATILPAQQASLATDKWYKVVGYVLPEDAPALPAGMDAGVFDVETGQKKLSTTVFRWNPERANDMVGNRFFVYNGQDYGGYTTDFDRPIIRELGNANVATIEGGSGVVDHDSATLTYSLNADGAPAKGDILSLNTATGQIQYKPHQDATGLDQFSIVASDADGNRTVIPIEVAISAAGANAPPVVPEDGFAMSVAENAASGTVVGTLPTITDPDGSSSYIDRKFIAGSAVYLFNNNYVTATADGRFLVERDSGRVLTQGVTPDFEAGATDFNYGLLITDNQTGLSHKEAETTLQISVTDVNEAHSLVAASYEINEYDKALGPLVPAPDKNGFAIRLPETMLQDPENKNMKWSFVAGQATGPWSLDQDGTLHMTGSTYNVSTQTVTYTLNVQAVDTALGVTKTASLTLNVLHRDASSTPPTLFEGGYEWGDDGSSTSGGGYRYLIPPVVLDLDGDGVELTSFVTSTVRFDMDGDGAADITGWAGADDGLLVFDRNHNGAADNVSEISFQSLVEGARSDLEGLSFFDSNENGRLDSADDAFGDFRVWRDADQDGVTDEGEMVSLNAAGIKDISLSPTPTGELPTGRDNVTFGTSQYTRDDGTQGAVGDVFLAFRPSFLDPAGDTGVPTADEPSAAPDEPAELAFSSRSFDRKDGKYSLRTGGGKLFVDLRGAGGSIDARAGAVGAATILTFKNRSIGMLDPIVLDLDGDGVELVRRKKSKAAFDMDGNGARDDTGWISRQDGFLVIDVDGNGHIDDGAELSLLALKPDAISSFDALATIDSNHDGRIDAADARFGELRLWVDRNGNGRSEESEIRALADHDIESIGLSIAATSGTAKPGENIMISTSTFTRGDGSIGSVGNAALAFRPSEEPASFEDLPEADWADRLTALRADLGRSTLGDGRFRPLVRWDLAGDPFAFAERPQSTAAAGEGEPVDANAAGNSRGTIDGEASALPEQDARRVAQMIQSMAGFAPRPGELARDFGQPDALRYDYHAA